MKKLPTLTEKEIVKFNSKIRIVDNGCHFWESGKSPLGYGNFYMRNTLYLAHRLAYELAYKVSPKDLCVCHSCDNPSCVNPKHLFLGTVKDNMLDKVRKGRSNPPTGTRQWKSKLDNKKVLKIRSLYLKANLSQEEIGKRYGIGQSNVSYIINHTWKHVA